MTYSFNLIDQPWIPCTMLDGSHAELSLQDTLLQAHEIREIFDQSPLVTAALHRLLLAILHRNFGPSSQSEWQTLWHTKQFDGARLNSYFSQWHNRFDLFHGTYPFYQVAGLEPGKKVKEIEINDLLPELPQANTATLFDHTIYDQTKFYLSPSEASRAVITIQSYKLGGLSGLGYSYWAAPSAQSICFLVSGDTLFETLLFNLVRYHGDEPIPVIDNDLPAWEQQMAETSSIPRGYLDYLSWQTLSLRLCLPPAQSAGEDIKIQKVCIGLGRDKFKHDGVFDPACAYQKNQNPKARDPWPATRYKQDRALWRDSAPLFRLTDEDKRPPLALKWMSELVNWGVLDAQKLYRLIAYGQCTNQAKIFFWRLEHLPLPAQYLTNEGFVEALEIALKNTEKVADHLKWAMERLARYALYPLEPMRKLKKDKNGKTEADHFADHFRATEAYWLALEVPFLDFIRDLPDDPDTALEGWNKRIQQVAHQAFNEATNDLDQSARVLRAIAEGQSHLASLVHKALSHNP